MHLEAYFAVQNNATPDSCPQDTICAGQVLDGTLAKMDGARMMMSQAGNR